MINRSKDLRRLFRESLMRRSSVASSSSYDVSGIHRVPNGGVLRIYFYEWSDIHRPPRTFYSLDSFERFLFFSGIKLEFYVRSMILNFGTVFISCYCGTKNLVIRSTYSALRECMDRYDESKLLNGIKAPKIEFEVENRFPNDGSFFG